MPQSCFHMGPAGKQHAVAAGKYNRAIRCWGNGLETLLKRLHRCNASTAPKYSPFGAVNFRAI